MFLAVVNKEGWFYRCTEEGVLVFNVTPNFATRFEASDLEIAKKDSAWREVFEAIDKGEAAFVPHPGEVFSRVVGGVEVYSGVHKAFPGRSLDLECCQGDEQLRDLFNALNLAEGLIQALQIKTFDSNENDALSEQLEWERGKVSQITENIAYLLGLLKDENGQIATQPGDFAAVLFPSKDERVEEDVFKIE